MNNPSNPAGTPPAPGAGGTRSERPLLQRVLGFPRTRVGWWAIGLLLACFVSVASTLTLVGVGRRGGDTFFSNPSLWLTLLVTQGFAIAEVIVGALAVFRRKERSLLVILAIVWGLLVLAIAVGGLGGRG
jgi:magnesium-transporting ATPase (P-type)